LISLLVLWVYGTKLKIKNSHKNKSIMPKEAVVFLLDANRSMLAPYPSKNSTFILEDKNSQTTKTTTRLDLAKQTVQDMLSDLILRSKQNEALVIVLKTVETKHHLYQSRNDDNDNDVVDPDSIPFSNLTELVGHDQDDNAERNGITRPNATLLRQVAQVQPASAADACDLRGDVCDGIIVAADALFRRTSGKKYQRRIVIFTDAQHKVQVDAKQLLVVLDSLRAMECRLEVIGLDFTESATFEAAAAAPSTKIIKEEPQGGIPMEQERQEKDKDDNSTETSSVDDEDDDDEEEQAMVKQQNQQLLIGLTEKTGGFVLAAQELAQILKAALGKRIPKSTKSKFVFQIAPNIVLEGARYSKLIQRATTPSLKKQVAKVKEEDNNNNSNNKISEAPLLNSLGEQRTTSYQEMVTYWDPDKEEREIEVDRLAKAYRYGSDLIPIGGYDLQGLMRPSPKGINILGYMDASKIPRQLCMGPPCAISGADSRKACAAISALARALLRLNQVAIATMIKMKDADPILVGLFPLETKDPLHLVVLQLPFKGDVPNLSLEPFEKTVDGSCNQAKACDNLIDSLMLPEDKLDYANIANPYIRSFHKTVVKRAMDPKCDVVMVRPGPDEEEEHEEEEDYMATPKDILKRAQPSLEEFRQAFPLKKDAKDDKDYAKKKKKGPVSYRDFLDDA
jgi:ATP-dependent DNA helicase 2 subunit 2